MNGIWILLLLIVPAALPAIIVYFWFRARKSPVTLPWFLTSFAAGMLSLLAAALVQRLFPLSGNGGLGWLFFGIFIRIALVEEASRLVTLVPLVKAGIRHQGMNGAFGAALGLCAGLGFAVLENAFYGTANINITLLRAFSAAPLHAACGVRVGAAVFNFSRRKAKAFTLFVSAVLIHGAYNLIIATPALPSVLAIFVACSALLASISLMKNTGSYDENPFA